MLSQGELLIIFFNFLSVFLIFIIIIRSIFNLINLTTNLRWILSNFPKYTLRNKAEHNFNICIPMLREQSIVKETLEYFAKLNYPQNKYRVYIVTTEREQKEKKNNYYLLDKLSEAIINKIDINLIFMKFGNLFSHKELEALYKSLKTSNELDVYKKLRDYYKNSPSTYALAIESANKINEKLGTKLVEVINYPESDGVMSHQINYLILKLSKSSPNSFFAIYNADSRPNKNTLLSVDTTISKFLSKNGYNANVIQQSSLFEYENATEANYLTKIFLFSASVFQSKWTLVHEISRLRYQSSNTLKIKPTNIISNFSSRISHCVGHGLFVRFEYLRKNLMPTETINEDLPYGFYQSCRGEPIIPIPILELSDSPLSIKSLINQKKVWFWPYIEYWKCKNIVLKSGQYRSKFEVIYLSLQGMFVGIIWFLQSVIFILPLISMVFSRQYSILLLYAFALTIYWIIPLYLITIFFYKNYLE